MDELIVALDVDTRVDALALASRLGQHTGAFKVGSQLFVSEGPDVVRELVANGHRVFLDLKFHDIPNTVAGAVRAATRLGAWMLTVHATGGSRMLRAAAEAGTEEAHRLGRQPPLIVAVTVLTSLDADGLRDVGIAGDVPTSVARLASLAREAGVHGVVASPHELAPLRASLGRDFVLVTPGIRPAGLLTADDDQARAATPREALAAGATYIVVGRPILRANDPVAAARRIAADVR